MGELGPFKAGNTVDQYLDLGSDILVSGEAVSSVVFTCKDAIGTTVPDTIFASTVTSTTRVDFRIVVPATAWLYEIIAVFTIDDGQEITRTAQFRVVA